MSFNGSGTFNINSTGQPVVSGTVISSSVFNALTADLATGLSTCLTKDGQTTVTANIPMNSYKITGLAAGTAATDAARVGQLQAGSASVVTVAGTDTYTGTMSPSLAAYAAGNTFTFVVPNTNTTASTLNIDGLGAKALTRDGSTALVAGDLIAGAEVAVVYDGTRFQVLNSNSKTNFNLSGTLTVAGNTTLSGGTANGVAYLNGSKVLTTGSALTFDGTNFATTGGIGATGATGITNTVGGNTARMIATAVATYFGSTTAADVVFQYNSTEGMRLTSTGLGIGTSSPAQKLHVAGNSQVKPTTGTDAVWTRTSNDSGEFYLGTDNSAGSGFTGTAYARFIYSTGAYPIAFYTNSSQRMLLDSSGNVGIGTSSPNYKLVVSNAGAQGFEFDPSTGIMQVYNRSTSAYGELRPYGSLMRFYTGTSPTETMRLDSSGNLGIGTSSATSRLTVSSTASTYAVDISSTNTSINNRTLNVYNSAATGTTALTNHIVRLASNASGADCTLQFTDSVANNGYIGMKSGALNFGANTTSTQMQLDTSGNLLVGTTSTGTTNSTSLTLEKANGYMVVNHVSGTASGAGYAIFGYNGSLIGSITQNGTTGVLFNITSDYRLKEFVAPVTNAGERIDALNPVEFDWKSDGSRARGFFAHEFQQVYANSVTGEKDAVDEDGNPVYQTMQASTAEVIADLVAEIKSLRVRLNALENK